MRPRELTMHGFRSYRDRTTFDFRGRRLVGIVGPIGSGKSSILDGIAFALYGKTPTVEGKTRSLIHQLADVAQVELIFEVDGQIWRVQRGLRRKGQSGHKLERLQDDQPQAEVLERVEGDRPARERVEQLLGMDFAAFCRSVLLAQNQFSEFLHAADRERNEVLKGVFGYERFDAALAAARGRVSAAEGVVSALEGEGARVAEARSALDGARAQANAASERAEAVEAARPDVEAIAERAALARRALDEAEAEADVIGRASAALPAAADIAQTVTTAEDAAREAVVAEDAVAAAEADSSGAQAERDATAAAAGDLRGFGELLARMDAAAAAFTRTAEREQTAAAAAARGAASSAEADAVLAALDRDRSTAEQAVQEAGAAAEAAEAALHAARHAEMAVELRTTLTAGDRCPVCGQVIAAAPRAGKAPATRKALAARDAASVALERATTARDEHRAALAAAGARVEAAHRAAEAAEADLQAAREEATVADAALTATQAEVVDRLGEGDPRALLDERQRLAAGAEARFTAAAAAASAARTAAEAARHRAAEAAAALSRVAATLAGVWGLLGSTETPEPTPAGIAAAFDGLGLAITERADRVATARDDARAKTREAADALAARLRLLGLDPDEDFTDALATVRAADATARERVRALEATVEAGEDLERRLQEAVDAAGLARRLRDDLQPSRFLAWLLAEEREALANLGSAHLEDLTAGAFRFAEDGSFDIADHHAADQVRSSGSLSGGETFLASLALALALAEMVARGGGRLDAFLLDEGFGSLDPEHLERAMEGIGRLVASSEGRMVVLVSHVELMREMIEDLIVLDKDERTGRTVVVSGASPASG